eukprot:GFKZ01004463.1.p1 GENE.GFKZ01004463.1~~GFKZ01004463.1.p1  ORF type:complete len:953 (+),score=173.80 GFKZ01004463.1:250-3108(+)
MGSAADALAERCYTSESSIGNEAPAIRHSRQVSNRALPAQSKARLQKLKAIRNRRLTRDRTSGFSPTSDDEDDRSATLVTLKNLIAVKSAPGPAHRRSKIKAARRLEKRNALRCLPRPSQVVQDIDEGSASDFGLREETRDAHRRRVSATVLGVQYLNSKGEQTPVPQWSLMRHGLQKYTRLMQPPKEDCFIRNPLTEPALLTRHYRGTLFAVQKLGESRRVRKKRLSQTSGCDSGVCADCEFWDATSGSEFLSSKEHDAPVKSLPREVEKVEEKVDKVLPSKADLVKQVLAESKSDESDSGGSSNDSSSVIGDEFSGQDTAYDTNGQVTVHEPCVTAPKDEHGVKQSQEEQLHSEDPTTNAGSGGDFLSEIFAMIDKNPDALREVPTGNGAPTTNAGVSSVNNKDTVIRENRSSERPQRRMTKFDKEKEKGMAFCQTKATAKRSRNGPRVSRKITEPERQKRKLDEVKDVINLAVDNENVNYGNATKMMEKMGFTGRLGAKEDGVKEPIRAPETVGRSGLGLGLYNPRGTDASSGGPNSAGGSGSGVTADVHIDELLDLSMDELPGQSGAPEKTRDCDPGIRGSESGDGCAENDLGEEDEYETDYDDSLIDNGRRGILVDVEVLIKNSNKRRGDAFRKVIEKLEKVERNISVEKVLVVEKKELCDADCIKEIARLTGLEWSAEIHTSLQQDLDDAFEQAEKVEVNFDLIRMLQGYSEEVHFGFFYRGSEKRLRAEMGSVYDLVKGSNGAMKLPEAFVTAPRVTVKGGDEWPYSGTWQDLMCRVGVRATQGIMLVNEGVIGSGMSCGFAAGTILGARTVTMVSVPHGVKMRLRGHGEEGETMELLVGEGVTLCENKRTLFVDFLKEKKRRARRRRVMALYGADNLWYCGREELGPEDGFGINVGRSMIRFFKLDRVEWVEDENVVGLCRRDYRKMRDLGFPGLLDVEDVEDM